MVSRLRLVGQAAAVGLVAALLGLLVWKLLHDTKSDVSQRAARGEHPVAPGFSLGRLNGSGTLSLASLRGRVVLLNFWASWCDPCKREAPRFQAAYERYRQRVAFVGVDTTD